MASNWRSMAEKKESNNGKVSYFLNISIKSKGMMTHEQPQPTVRIKIPKLLVKTVHQKKKKKKKMKEHRNSDYDDDDDDDDDDNDDHDHDDNDDDGGDANRNRSLVKFSNPANKFIKDKVTSLFSNVVSKFKNSASSSTCSRCNRTSSSFIGRNREIKEQVCTSCRVLKKIRSIGSARKEIFPGKGSRRKIKTDEEEGEELCKRRILMGERCRHENELSE